EPFLFQYLCYIPSIHKHICDGAAVDILTMGYDADRPFFEELLQPLSGFWPAWFVQFRCVDAAESDAFRSHAKSIAVDGVDRLAGGNFSPGDPAQGRGLRLFLVRRDFVSTFG
ncbi:MAG: hypothetical protein AAB047_00210, partial [Nitrospirota bacterium]